MATAAKENRAKKMSIEDIVDTEAESNIKRCPKGTRKNKQGVCIKNKKEKEKEKEKETSDKKKEVGDSDISKSPDTDAIKMEITPDFFLYNEGGNLVRPIIVLDVELSNTWSSTKIAFYKSSGMSNATPEYSNIWFPTFGIGKNKDGIMKLLKCSDCIPNLKKTYFPHSLTNLLGNFLLFLIEKHSTGNMSYKEFTKEIFLPYFHKISIFLVNYFLNDWQVYMSYCLGWPTEFYDIDNREKIEMKLFAEFLQTIPCQRIYNLQPIVNAASSLSKRLDPNSGANKDADINLKKWLILNDAQITLNEHDVIDTLCSSLTQQDNIRNWNTELFQYSNLFKVAKKANPKGGRIISRRKKMMKLKKSIKYKK
jgi:hypothetical protein